MKNILLALCVILTAGTATAGMTEVPGGVSIPLEEINDGKAHYYDVEVDGKDVSFFVIKSRDNVIRAAFDACDVCYPEQKGYSQSGEFMICNNCGQRFHSTRINVVKGGCNPSPLTRKVAGDYLIIRNQDLLAGSKYF